MSESPREAREFTGPYGTARRVPRENFAQTTQLDCWIVTAPLWHRLWSQYVVSAITLADVPGMPPAVKHRPAATHELLVMALNPEHGHCDAARVGEARPLRLLLPANVCEQFIAPADDAVRDLVALCAHAVVDGVLCPETGDAPDRIRAEWRQTIHQTLDHGRDPHHGRAN